MSRVEFRTGSAVNDPNLLELNIMYWREVEQDNSGLRIDEKLQEIIQYYIIIERNRKKFTQSTYLTMKRTAGSPQTPSLEK